MSNWSEINKSETEHPPIHERRGDYAGTRIGIQVPDKPTEREFNKFAIRASAALEALHEMMQTVQDIKLDDDFTDGHSGPGRKAANACLKMCQKVIAAYPGLEYLKGDAMTLESMSSAVARAKEEKNDRS